MVGRAVGKAGDAGQILAPQPGVGQHRVHQGLRIRPVRRPGGAQRGDDRRVVLDGIRAAASVGDAGLGGVGDDEPERGAVAWPSIRSQPA